MKSKKYRLFGRILLPVALAIVLSISMLPGGVWAEEGTNTGEEAAPDPVGDTAEWTYFEADTPTGKLFRLFEHWGGFWADAEKDPNPGDDLLCWAATASNMLEWTGWGFVGGMEFGNTDDFFQFYRGHVTDKGYYIDLGIKWWFDGELVPVDDPLVETVDHKGFWSPMYNPGDYIFLDDDDANALQDIGNQITAGRPVGLGVYPLAGKGGHAITCWGFNYDDNYSPADIGYYQGIWVSDSDSHKDIWNPQDMLAYYAVSWNATGNRWEMPSYGCFIGAVYSLAVFPGATRPTADAGGPYIGYEGTPVTFNASGSTDDDTLWYRWDLDNDGVWDTGWLTNTTANFTWDDDRDIENVYLEVFDERLRDMSTAPVTILNVAPAVTADGDEIDESGLALVSGSIEDPGILDTFTVLINWGDSSWNTYNYTAGTTWFSQYHQYLDDNPTGTPSDAYNVTVTVHDKDLDQGTAYATVTVNNVNPVVAASGDVIDENGLAQVSGNITDPGSLDTFRLVIDWGDGSSNTYNYTSGTTCFNETHQYLDDNPTGTPSDIYDVTVNVTDDDGGVGTTTTTVTVNNVDPVVEEPYILSQPNEEFILPVIPGVEFAANFTDVGTLDTHTAIWNWGDGTTSIGSVTESGGSGNVTGSHTYMLAGNYTVIVTVTDDDTGSHNNTMILHVADVDEALDIFNQYIQDLPDSSFKSKPAQRKNAFSNVFSALQDKWLEQEYQGMIQDLRNSIRSKADGLIDGKASDDWIKDREAQEHICQQVDNITVYLEYLLSI